LGNGEAIMSGTADDMRAAADYLRQHYPDGVTGPRHGPVFGPVLDMTWTKLGDEFPAEARELTDAELRTHVEALCWSSLRLLDLRIPKRDVRRFAESPAAPEAVEGLTAKGWWKDLGDEWDISLKFAEWQEERVVVDKRREDAAARKRRSRLHRAGDHSLCIPGGTCPHVTRDSTRDSTRDGTRRRGRVGSGPTDPPDPPKDQDHSAANSQKRRVHDGPDNSTSDDQQIPDPVTHQSPATDRNARANGTAP
jgi:hypothetical protein